MAIEWPSTINASPGCIKAKNWRLGRDVASTLKMASLAVSPFVSFCQRRLRDVLASVIVCCSRASADAIPDHSLGGVALVPPIGGAFVMPACPPGWFPAAPWCAGGPCGTAPALLVPAGAPRFSGTSWLRCLGGPWPCPIPSPHGCPMPCWLGHTSGLVVGRLPILSGWGLPPSWNIACLRDSYSS